MANRMHSSWRAVKREVPQRSVLELVLLNIFASDPEEEMKCFLIKSIDDARWYPQKQEAVIQRHLTGQGIDPTGNF